MKKRLISGFLAVVMIFSLLPVNAFATDEVPVVDEIATTEESVDIVALEPVEVEENDTDPVEEVIESDPVDETENTEDVQIPEMEPVAEPAVDAIDDENGETVENTEISGEEVTPETPDDENECTPDADNCRGGGGH